MAIIHCPHCDKEMLDKEQLKRIIEPILEKWLGNMSLSPSLVWIACRIADKILDFHLTKDIKGEYNRG